MLHAKLRSFENQRKYLGNVWIDLGSTQPRMQSPLGSREGLKGWGLGSLSLKKGLLFVVVYWVGRGRSKSFFRFFRVQNLHGGRFGGYNDWRNSFKPAIFSGVTRATNCQYFNFKYPIHLWIALTLCMGQPPKKNKSWNSINPMSFRSHQGMFRKASGLEIHSFFPNKNSMTNIMKCNGGFSSLLCEISQQHFKSIGFSQGSSISKPAT